ncbi:MAG: hypothetical protein M0026_06455 [Nocardiopsaceae bacterium]|nr:hypothetical protein [Nocardiopsaceae bacterium]
MSIMVMFGIGTVAMFGLLVALFLVAVVSGPDAAPEDESADDDTIDEVFHTHGVHFC